MFDIWIISGVATVGVIMLVEDIVRRLNNGNSHHIIGRSKL